MERAGEAEKKKEKERRQRRPAEPKIKVLISVGRGAESRVVYCCCVGLVWLCVSSSFRSFLVIGSVEVHAARHLVHHLESLLETVVGVAGLFGRSLIVVPNEHPASIVDGDPLRRGKVGLHGSSWYGTDLELALRLTRCTREGGGMCEEGLSLE